MSPDNLLQEAWEWIRYAEADIAIAEAPLPEKGMYEHLCFHAQQTAEKAIKSILVSQGITVPKTHNIEYLLTLIPSDISIESLPTNASKLTGYATIFRYPGEEEPVSLGDYLELLTFARIILTWAISVLDSIEERVNLTQVPFEK